MIRIKASPKQLSKLRNGHKVRIQPAMKGEGFNLIVHPERYDELSKTFKSGKGREIQLTPQELVANQHAAPHMEGSGIFGSRFDRFLDKHGMKDAAYAVGDVIKPYAKAGIKTALTAGATALGAAQPHLIPLIAPGLIGASSFADDYLDHPGKYQNMFSSAQAEEPAPAPAVYPPPHNMFSSQFTRNAGGPKDRTSQRTLKGQVETNEMLDDLSRDTGAHYGALARANLGNAVAHRRRAQTRGRGVHREISSVGTAGSFIGSHSVLPPAMISQPFSANFQFRHFLPPAYSQYSKGGGGLYV